MKRILLAVVTGALLTVGGMFTGTAQADHWHRRHHHHHHHHGHHHHHHGHIHWGIRPYYYGGYSPYIYQPYGSYGGYYRSSPGFSLYLGF